MPTTPDPSELEKKARFVFHGTVVKTKAATMPNVPVSPRTAVVRVDQIIQAPPAMAQVAGREVTVDLGEGRKVKPGQRATFYTNGWLFGDGLAVRAVGLAPVRPVAEAAAAAGPADQPARARTESDLKQRVDDADLVVAGRVSGVRLPSEDAAARALAAAGEPAAGGQKISEHDPLWQEAVIDVDDVIKGSHRPKKIVVRFPSSTDVRWHKAPKFHPGQEGVWMLNREQVQGAETPALAVAEGAGDEGAPTYTAVGPLDYQPPQRLDQLKLLAAASKNP
jgi:hypothetical protein